MSYLIINYEIINGSKLESKPKAKRVKSLSHINALQERAERIWNQNVDEDHKVTVLINYVNFNKHNPRSPNIGIENFKLDKWI